MGVCVGVGAVGDVIDVDAVRMGDVSVDVGVGFCVGSVVDEGGEAVGTAGGMSGVDAVRVVGV